MAILASCAPSRESIARSDFDRGFDQEARSATSRPKADSSTLEGYKVQVDRIVKNEWDRNCHLMRDYIVPSSLTVRCFVYADGRVKNISIVRSDTNEMGKRLTLKAVRNSVLPAMPKEFGAGYVDTPLEFIFNFHF